MGKGLGSPMVDEEWKAESDLRTLIDAEKIKRDPKRMKAVRAKKHEMKAALEGIKE